METPAQRLQKYLKELLVKFSKTPFAVPAAVALSAGVYYLVIAYMTGFCLSSAIAPLFMLGILWMFDVKSVKKLLIIGAVSCLVFAGVLVAFTTNMYRNIEPTSATSDYIGFGGTEPFPVMVDGGVTPWFGDKSTVFNYTITVKNSTANVSEVKVIIVQGYFPYAKLYNETMSVLSNTSNTTTYYHTKTTSKAVNYFYFMADIGGEWTLASYHSGGSKVPVNGPIFPDTLAIAQLVTVSSLFSAFFGFLPIYGLILLMIWWTRKSRKMREEQLKKWEAKRTEEEAQKGKQEVKVPSLAKAMGMEAEETFVCSECGADVPADAKVCPKCGEKFD